MIETIVISLILIVPAFIVLMRNFGVDLYFWQLKEYRWDRFWTHIRWDFDTSNRDPFIVGIKFLLFGLVSLMFTVPIVAAFGIFLAFIIWVFESIETLQMYIGKKLIRPAIKQPRNLIILSLLAISVVSSAFFVMAPFLHIERTVEGSESVGKILNLTSNINNDVVYPDIFILLALLTALLLLFDLGTPIFVGILVGLTYPIAKIRREIVIKKAENKLKKLNDLKIIGITGSQGKTTTKELLYHLIKEKFKTKKTPENYNTDFGVATALLTEVNNNTEIFIAEMGAYRKGELKKIVKHFPPNVSIVTNLEYQHVGLFGSVEDLCNAKSEIIKHKKDNGFSVINLDGKYSDRLINVCSGKRILISKNEQKLSQYDDDDTVKYHLSSINEGRTNLKFKINSEEISVAQKGKHLIHNIAIAIAVALELGVTMDEIKTRLGNLELKLPRLTIESGDSDTVVLNDSYNSSYSGFIAAVDVMSMVNAGHYEDIKKEKGRTIVLTNGISELGKHKQDIYRKLVDKTRKNIDFLITSDSMLAKYFHEENNNTIVVLAKNKDDMLFETRKIMQKNDTLLLEGRLHPRIIAEIVSDRA